MARWLRGFRSRSQHRDPGRPFDVLRGVSNATRGASVPVHQQSRRLRGLRRHVSTADPGLAKFLPEATITRNALVSIGDTADGQGAVRNRPPGINQTMYTSFANAAAAGINDDGTLSPKSPNRRAGTDGRDIGVDFDELKRVGSDQFLRK